MHKVIKYGPEYQQRILDGVDKIGDLVESTYGPEGRNVIIYDGGYEPLVTKDGATAADSVDSDDPYERIGILLEKGIIDKVDSIAGDGSTTTTIYSRHLFREAVQANKLGFDPKIVRDGMADATEAAIGFLKENSIKLSGSEEDKINFVEKVATIATNGNKDLINCITESYKRVGKDGAVIIEESHRKDNSSYVDMSTGIEWDGAPFSEGFILDAKNCCTEVEMPKILLMSFCLDNYEDIAHIAELVKLDSKKLVVIVPAINSAVIPIALKNSVTICRGPDLREKGAYEDLAAIFGTRVVTKLGDIPYVIKEVKDLGEAKRVHMDYDGVSILQKEELTKEEYERFKSYVDKLKAKLNSEDSLTATENELLNKRIAKLAGGIAVMHIGAPSSTEIEEKMALITDAINSVQHALTYGILPGGGVAMLRCATYLSNSERYKFCDNVSYRKGWEAVMNSLRVPATILLKSTFPNDYQYLVQKIANDERFNFGINLLTKKECDMVEEGVIDAALIEYTCLKHSNSVIGSFLISSGIVTNENTNITHGYNSERIMRS